MRSNEKSKSLNLDGNMAGYIITALVSLIVGSGATIALSRPKQPETEIKPEQVAVEQQEVIKQLTNTDLLEIPCSQEYILENGDLLCREMFCRMMTRGVDSETSGAECEQISNISNSKSIIKHCEAQENQEDCYNNYFRRK